MGRVTLFLCLVLAACATPREACLTAANREVLRLDRLILEVKGNLQRGYAIAENRPTAFAICLGEDNVETCFAPAPPVRERAIPIDPAAERRKLSALTSARSRAAARAAKDQAACPA